MNRRKKEDKFQQQSILEGDTFTCYDSHGSADTCMYLKQVKNVDQNDVIRRGGGVEDHCPCILQNFHFFEK